MKFYVVLAYGIATLLPFANLFTATSTSKRELTFSHGMDGKYGYGSTSSTKVESSMKNVITVSFSDKNESYSKTAASGDSSKCIVYTDYLGKRKGSHSCTYYVNGFKRHESTKAWGFDFSKDWW